MLTSDRGTIKNDYTCVLEPGKLNIAPNLIWFKVLLHSVVFILSALSGCVFKSQQRVSLFIIVKIFFSLLFDKSYFKRPTKMMCDVTNLSQQKQLKC